jgi:hypothetical protein
MVSISTRRLPSTWIEDTVWAMAGDATSVAASDEIATGVATMIRAANMPPRIRIPTFMRTAPLSFQAGPLPREPTDSPQLPCL